MTHGKIASVVLSAVAALTVTVVAPGLARADETVEAEVLFQEGKRLLKAGDVAGACEKFEGSARLETTVGVLLNAADCRERNQQLATAWGLFLKASALAHREGKDAKREQEARRRADLLARRLSYLTISVPDSSKVEGLVITRRGQPIDPALWNQGVPVDVGEYEISASAPGQDPWNTKVNVAGEGTKAVVEVPRFKQIADLAEPVRPPRPPPSREPVVVTAPLEVERVEPPPAPSRFTGLRKLGLGLGVVGVGAVAGGAVFGLQARDKQDQADAICPDTACGDPRGVALNDDAKSAALKSNVLFGVGAAAVAGAVVLWFVGAPASAAADQVTTGPALIGGSAGWSVTGSF